MGSLFFSNHPGDGQRFGGGNIHYRNPIGQRAHLRPFGFARHIVVGSQNPERGGYGAFPRWDDDIQEAVLLETIIDDVILSRRSRIVLITHRHPHHRIPIPHSVGPLRTGQRSGNRNLRYVPQCILLESIIRTILIEHRVVVVNARHATFSGRRDFFRP